MDERTYTINELKTLIIESANEFKAKIGNDVEQTNRKENQNSYKETKSKVKNYDGGGDEFKSNTKVDDKEDGNKTTLDYALESPVVSDYKDRVQAQSEGYTSTLEKNNKIEKIGEFSDKSYKQFKKAGKEMAKNKVIAKKSGLTARQLPDSAFEKEDLYKESKKISVLNFKNTTFINESQMISRIPDDYKINGNRFKVKDSSENEFIVEWKDGEASILSYENKKKLNETVVKFQNLISYNPKSVNKISTSYNRSNCNNDFNKVLQESRTITNKK